MNRMRNHRWLLIAACILFVGLPVFAHHGFTEFAMDKDVTYTGTVVDFNWVNPHVHITIKVPDGASDAGTAGTWDIEGGAPGIMARQGWNKISYKPGDPITLVAHPLKNGGKGASLFYAIRPDGTRLYHDIARPRDGEKAN
jgi:hypothetical protein